MLQPKVANSARLRRIVSDAPRRWRVLSMRWTRDDSRDPCVAAADSRL